MINHKPSSLQASVSNHMKEGKEKITDFFNKRKPMGRGGGGMFDITSFALQGNNNSSTLQSVNHSAQDNRKPPPGTDKASSVTDMQIDIDDSLTNTEQSNANTPMMISNDNVAMNYNNGDVAYGTSSYDNRSSSYGSVSNTIKVGQTKGNNDATSIVVNGASMSWANAGALINNGLPAGNVVKAHPTKGTIGDIESGQLTGKENAIIRTNGVVINGEVTLWNNVSNIVGSNNGMANYDVNPDISANHIGTDGNIPNTGINGINNGSDNIGTGTGDNVSSDANSGTSTGGVGLVNDRVGVIGIGDDSNPSVVENEASNQGVAEAGSVLPAAVVLAPKIFATLNTTVVSFHIRPTGEFVEFNLEEIFAGMIEAFTAVDPTMWFKSWNTAIATRVWLIETIPTTDDEMKNFVEDAHTAPIGPFGRFVGRITIISSVAFEAFRRNKVFSAWLRETGLFIDRSELACTRPKEIGFFNKKLPHDTRIPFFMNAISQMVKFRKPMQILSKPLYEGPGSVLKCFVYVMIADPKDEADILADMANFKHPELEFYQWSAFKDSKKQTTKVGIINEMNTFARDHSSILIKGLKENCLMRLRSTTSVSDEDYMLDDDDGVDLVDSVTMDSKADEETLDKQVNRQLQDVTCVNFLYNHFIDSEGKPIYVQINGPCNGLTEVVFHNNNWDQARKIEKQFQAVMIKYMTSASIKRGFTNGAQLIRHPSDIVHWNPPVLHTRTNPANTMNDVDSPPLSKKLRHVNFSYTTKSDY